MGDLNSKVGNDKTENVKVMGKHGCGLMNENGVKLLEFCNNNNLVVRGTLFFIETFTGSLGTHPIIEIGTRSTSY